MKPFFDDHTSLEQLQEVATSWIGTPFRENGRIKGPAGGVSCHLLVSSIYQECGVLPTGSEIPNGPASWARSQSESLIERFIRTDQVMAQRFAPILSLVVEPGDLLGFRIGKIVHHLGVLVAGHHFIHCFMHTGVQMHRIDDHTYASRLAAVWRPLKD